MIKYIKHLPLLAKGFVLSFVNFFRLTGWGEGFRGWENDTSTSNNVSRDAAERSAINVQRAAYWSGSSKIYR